MRCKSCEYPLWQIKARQCPECGTPFVPSAFEFTLNSVQFCCQHCGQDYYGTGANGHLVPRSFACVRCARNIDMDEMVLLPTTGVTEKQTEVTVVPWVQRRGRNWFFAFFSTMGMGMGNPVRMINAVPEQSSGWRAFLYALLNVISQTLLGCWPVVLIFFGISMASGTGAGVGVFVMLGAVAIAVPALLGLAILIAHGVLRLTGPMTMGLSRTAHAICYSSGNNFITGTPCIGFYFLWAGGLWWAITAGFMLAAGQKVRGWRAGLAVSVPIVLGVGSVVGGIAWAIYAADQRLSATMAAAAPTYMNTQVSTVNSTLLARMRRTNEGPLTHVAELMVNGQLTSTNFLDMNMGGSGGMSAAFSISKKLNSTTVGGRSLQSWLSDTPPVRSGAAAKAVASLPTDTVAYRVGDLVFTHPGVDIATPPNGQTWLVVSWPESLQKDGSFAIPNAPATPPPFPGTVLITVGQADGATRQFDVLTFDTELAAQNALRQQQSLPLLPHPMEVTADKPGVAGDAQP